MITFSIVEYETILEALDFKWTDGEFDEDDHQLAKMIIDEHKVFKTSFGHLLPE